MRRVRAASPLLALVLLLPTACSDGTYNDPTAAATTQAPAPTDEPAPTDGPTDDPTASSTEDPTVASLPDLPDPVDLKGTIETPLMEPAWLVRSTGTDESGTYDVWDQRLLVHGDVVLYQVLDTLMAVSLTDGSTLWRSPVDMGGEIVDHAGTAVHHDRLWSFVYSKTHGEDLEEWGDHVVTLDITTGEIVGDVTLDSYGTATAMGVQSGEQLIALDTGLSVIDESGALRPVLPMRDLGVRGAEIDYLSPIAGTDVITLEVSGRNGAQAEFAGYDVVRERLLWTVPVSRFTPSRFEQGYVYLNRLDGRYVTQRDWTPDSDQMVHLWTLDPQTGKELAYYLHRPKGQGPRFHQMRITESDLGGGTPHGMAVVGDDIVFVDFQGVSRFSPLEGRWVWSTRRRQMKVRHGDSDYSSFGLGPVSADGSLVYAFLSAGYSGDLVAIDLETGAIRGRWAMDDAQESGLVTEPLIELTDGGVVLARNRAVEGDPTILQDKTKPLGPLNDLGLLRFPELD